MLLSGYPPFYGTESQMFQKIKEGRYFMREDRWSKVSSDGRAFVRGAARGQPGVAAVRARGVFKNAFSLVFDSSQLSNDTKIVSIRQILFDDRKIFLYHKFCGF